ncbi:PepSY-associated TM helix domain-containing protein [Xylophilus sp. ASV27]|uniref:PepSY-associated TM helix domain-containing protein n=1 Tax=Xylophilus sp. ASV27 TaxID=2795129 RepID=UPI0018ECDF95|nr:PepSY-associated TM helix domain-containing protein [Xylophilus sp. ASV27]
MRAEHVRIYKSVHTWTGIISGMALFVAFYAGALTVFKEPIRRWSTPPAAIVHPVPLDDVQPLIVKTFASTPAAARGAIVRLEGGQAIPRVEWQVRDAKVDEHDENAARHYTAMLSADGSVQVSEQRPSRLVEFIDVLHRVVGLPVDSDPNRWVMGVISGLYFVALVSGVVVLLPSLVKDFFALRAGRNLKRMWLDAHNVVGIVSLPFHIVMALSAVVFAFHDQIFEVQDRLIHQGRWAQAFARPRDTAEQAPGRNPADMLKPAQLVQIVRQAAPGFEPERLQYAQVTGPKPAVRVWGKNPQAVSPRAVGGFAALDPYSGKLISADYMSGAQNTPNLFISSFFALHMASFGGVAVWWLYFLLGLAGAWLFYSGNLLWVETRRKAQRKGGDMPVQRRDTAFMASATVGVCLGCVAGISLTIAAAKWLPGRVDDVPAWHMGIYYAVFFASVGWAFWRGAARAAVPLLWLAAACTAAIPLSSALAGLLPQSGLWADSTLLGVDLTALAGVLALAWIARATKRRVHCGPADSVWAVRRGM